MRRIGWRCLSEVSIRSLHRYPVKSCLAEENSWAEILQAPKPSSLSVQGIASAQVLCVEARGFVTFLEQTETLDPSPTRGRGGEGGGRPKPFANAPVLCCLRGHARKLEAYGTPRRAGAYGSPAHSGFGSPRSAGNDLPFCWLARCLRRDIKAAFSDYSHG